MAVSANHTADAGREEEDEPDPAHVHRRGEHDGLRHHHAAGEHGAGRRHLAPVLAGHGRRLDGDRLRLRPSRPVQPAPRRHVGLCRGRLRKVRAISWSSSSTSCRSPVGNVAIGISAVGYLAGFSPWLTSTPDDDLHRADRAPVADHRREFRRPAHHRPHRLDHGLGRDHPRRHDLAHRLVLVQRGDFRRRLEPQRPYALRRAWAPASR